MRSVLARMMIGAFALTMAGGGAAQDFRARPPEDEIVYFLLPDRFDNADPANDRGGLAGGRLQTGFDPTDKAFYHGGDLKGVARRLDYIKGLGATAIWLAPVFRNRPVQGPPGHESAGYHGYWITDFTTVDPHFGTEAEFGALVEAAHARGIKVYLDIVVNHTADIIRYRECPPAAAACPYRAQADYPYQRRGGVAGASINTGFGGDGDASPANWARLTDPRYAYTPYIPAGLAHAKKPDWLNDPLRYHNRGDSTFAGESSTMGDFFGLDDLMTEDPKVIAGFIDIYGGWIDRFRIDGFRIDTAQHVDPAFWRAFVPAMQARARAAGIPNFALFGEVATSEMDPARLAAHTVVDGLPAVLDFAFRRAVADTVAGTAAPTELARLFAADPLYAGGEAGARRQPTFLGNHDQGRFAHTLRDAFPKASEAELLARDLLGHAMLMTLRGVPVVYAGDEQGFAGHGDDQDARQDMFASRVASYVDQPLIGTSATGATDSFRPDHPLYRAIGDMARLRAAHPALRRGRQVIRFAADRPGLLAVSRFDPNSGAETLVLFNTATAPVEANVAVEVASARFATLLGTCPVRAQAPGSVHVALPALGYAVCEARR